MHIVGAIDDATFERLVAHMKAIGENGQRDEVVLTALNDAPMPSVARRRRLTETITAAQAKGGYIFAGHAVVTNNSVTRGLLTALNWVVKPKYDERVFKAPPPALEWLTTRCPTLQPSAVLADLARANPEFGFLRW